MPEGDTVHKIANYLKPRLNGQRLTLLMIADRSASTEVNADRVVEVRAAGKHLYIDLDTGGSVRTHLGMHGSWHRYPDGQPWQKPRSRASVVLTVADNHYVCFNAKEVELIATPGIRSSIVAGRTGPDLTTGKVDFDAVLARAYALAGMDSLLIDVLLDQRVASGIGNVYKSELMFIHRLHQDTRLQGVDAAVLKALYRSASGLLASNIGGGRRVTRRKADGAGRLWVYRRAGLPCHRCEQPIATARLGRHHRSTYWCPDCQSAANQDSEIP